jgi:hypothetical protein
MGSGTASPQHGACYSGTATALCWQRTAVCGCMYATHALSGKQAVGHTRLPAILAVSAAVTARRWPEEREQIAILQGIVK